MLKRLKNSVLFMLVILIISKLICLYIEKINIGSAVIGYIFNLSVAFMLHNIIKEINIVIYFKKIPLLLFSPDYYFAYINKPKVEKHDECSINSNYNIFNVEVENKKFLASRYRIKAYKAGAGDFTYTSQAKDERKKYII